MKTRTARLLALSALSLALTACDNLPAPLAKLFGQETAPASAVQAASTPASAPAAASDASAPAASEASAPAQKKSPHGKRRRHR